MGGPCKNIKGAPTKPEDKCGKFANPSRSGHPRKNKLAGRVAEFERCERTSKTTIHKPGSENRKK